jgi:hypothetical protein
LGGAPAILLPAFRMAPRRALAGALSDPLAGVLAAAVALAGCGAPRPATTAPPSNGIPAALIAGRRPIGVGPGFESRASGPVIGRCRRALGRRRGAHIELFAANKVVLIPAGIGIRGRRATLTGAVAGRCYGSIVTVQPTGVALLAPGARLTLAALFRSWGEPLTRTRLAAFPAPGGGHVAVYVGGRPWRGAPGAVPLRPHSEIVLEVGPHVPPHRTFTFPSGL